MNNSKDVILHDVKIRENVLLRNVYLWMIAGLLVTTAVSFALSRSLSFIQFFYSNPMVMVGAFIAELVLVMALSGRIERLRTGSAIALFIAYSAVTGMTLTSLINMFLGSSALDLLISAVGVLLFTGLTAWDSQKIADMNRSYGSMMTNEELTKIGILGALDLYLDFLNIFLYLLRIFGRSSDN